MASAAPGRFFCQTAGTRPALKYEYQTILRMLARDAVSPIYLRTIRAMACLNSPRVTRLARGPREKDSRPG